MNGSFSKQFQVIINNLYPFLIENITSIFTWNYYISYGFYNQKFDNIQDHFERNWKCICFQVAVGSVTIDYDKNQRLLVFSLVT